MAPRSGVGARLPLNCRAGPREAANGPVFEGARQPLSTASGATSEDGSSIGERHRDICGYDLSKRRTSVEDDVRAKWHRFRKGARSHEAAYECDCGVWAREAAFENNLAKWRTSMTTANGQGGGIRGQSRRMGIGLTDASTWCFRRYTSPRHISTGLNHRTERKWSEKARGFRQLAQDVEAKAEARWSRITPDHRAAFGTWCRRSGSRAFRIKQHVCLWRLTSLNHILEHLDLWERLFVLEALRDAYVVAAAITTDETAGDETSIADTTATDDEPAIDETDDKIALGDTGTTTRSSSIPLPPMTRLLSLLPSLPCFHNISLAQDTLHLSSLSQDVHPGQDKGTFLAKDARLGKNSVLHVFGVLAKTSKTPKTNMFFY
ncbi:hypothetical protein DFH09DRAFT_1285706 [Mycena vulgaris]|nr:hypothetical protein DFH09DRAFT_1285706 [Mycena vulgaris]